MSKVVPEAEVTGLPAGILGLRIAGGSEKMHNGLYSLVVSFVACVPEEAEGVEHVEIIPVGTTDDPGTLKDGVSDKTWLMNYGRFKELCDAAQVKLGGQRIDKVLAALVEQDVVAHVPAPGYIANFSVPADQVFAVTFTNHDNGAEKEEAAPKKRGRPAAVPAPPAPPAPPVQEAAPPAPPRPPASTPVPKRFGAK